MKFETKWNNIRKNVLFYNVANDADKIFERPLGAEHWGKKHIKCVAHTSVLL